jgi:hypothetical protein
VKGIGVRLPSIRASLAALAALTAAIGIAGTASADDPIVITGLEAPRGLTSIGSQVLIAEQGTGSILRVSDLGTKTVIATGLPTTVADSPEGPLPAGPSAVIQVGATYYVAVGEAPGTRGFDALYQVQEGSKPTLIADLLAYEKENNVDGGELDDGEPELNMNAYDLVWDGKSGIFVTGAGANAIFHVSVPDGEITTYALFPDRPNPLFAQKIGGPTMQTVPTGLVVGPDGALYVSTLTGFPFPQGGAAVYRVEDKDKDGDALESGEVTVFASGLTTATDLAFDKDGSLLVAQFSLNMLTQAPGNVVRIRGGAQTVVGAPLVSPTGLTVLNDGTILVAQEFLGIVADIDSAAKIVASAGGPGGPGGAPTSGGSAPVRPPSTGDGGLAGAGDSAWLPFAAIALIVSGSYAALLAVRARR